MRKQKKQNKLLNIGVVNRYNEAVEKLAEMNANGEFGKSITFIAPSEDTEVFPVSAVTTFLKQ